MPGQGTARWRVAEEEEVRIVSRLIKGLERCSQVYDWLNRCVGGVTDLDSKIMNVGWLGQIRRKTEFEMEIGEWLEGDLRTLWACSGQKFCLEVA